MGGGRGAEGRKRNKGRGKIVRGRRREPGLLCWHMKAKGEHVLRGKGDEWPHCSHVVWEVEGQLGESLWTWHLSGPL